jgi:hypothetical protein
MFFLFFELCSAIEDVEDPLFTTFTHFWQFSYPTTPLSRQKTEKITTCTALEIAAA